MIEINLKKIIIRQSGAWSRGMIFASHFQQCFTVKGRGFNSHSVHNFLVYFCSSSLCGKGVENRCIVKVGGFVIGIRGVGLDTHNVQFMLRYVP